MGRIAKARFNFQIMCFVGILVLCIACIVVPVSGQVHRQELFPFGLANGDSAANISDDGFTGPITLTQAFPFFNDKHYQLFVNNNGAISFRRGIPEFTPICGALDSMSTMISPFWSDVDIRNGGQLYFRESTNEGLLVKAENEVRKTFPRIWSIALEWLYIVTWDQVAFYGSCPAYPADPRNTFQLILTTDGVHSFVIFYYNDLTWTSGTSSSPAEVSTEAKCLGLGGVPAKAGFDVGDGATFHEIDGSCTPQILHLVSRSNMGEAGKWIFRVDNNFESASGCDDPSRNLIISPAFVSPLARQWISLRGPCLNDKGLNIKCQFHDPAAGADGRLQISSAIIDPLKPLAYCQVPYFHTLGKLNISLIVPKTNSGSGDSNDVYYDHIYVSEPRSGVKVLFLGNSIILEWNPNSFDQSVTMLDLIILAYENETLKETQLVSRFPNSGRFSGQIGLLVNSAYSKGLPPFTLELISTLGNRNPVDILGAISQEGRNLKNGMKALTSRTMCFPLLTHLLTDFQLTAALRCAAWYRNDPGVPKEGIEPCPPKVTQAFLDRRFTLDDGFYDQDYFHPGGDKSFRQTTPSRFGGRMQCVYDKSGNLIMDGAGRGTIVGTWNHYWKDVQPYCDCCKYSNSCFKYMDKRPGDDGHSFGTYAPPRYARSVGDPHITTFDSLSYMFNGVGEFWMVRSANFSMQTRMEPLGFGTASICTSFVMDDGVTRVQVQGSVDGGGIDILLDGQLVSFPEDSDENLLAQTVRIFKDSSRGQTVVVFSAGFTFTFTVSGRSLNLQGSSSTANAGKVNGLLGHFDDDSANDLMTPNGTIVSYRSGSRTIHYDFGLFWMTTSSESIFTYGEGKSWSTYAKPDFQPWFEMSPGSSQTVPTNVVTVCGNSSECLFDWAASGGNLEFASATRRVVQIFDETVREMRRPVLMCSPLPVLNNGRFELVNRNYMVGSMVDFTCDEGYDLIGPKSMTCLSAGLTERQPFWSHPNPVCLPIIRRTTQIPTSVTPTGIADGFSCGDEGGSCNPSKWFWFWFLSLF